MAQGVGFTQSYISGFAHSLLQSLIERAQALLYDLLYFSPGSTYYSMTHCWWRLSVTFSKHCHSTLLWQPVSG